MLLVSVFFGSLLFQQEKRRNLEKHHTNKHSCTSPTLDFTTKVKLRLYLHCSERAYHSFFTFAPRCWRESRRVWKLEMWAEKWTRNGKVSSRSVTDKKIAWVCIFSSDHRYTHKPTLHTPLYTTQQAHQEEEDTKKREKDGKPFYKQAKRLRETQQANTIIPLFLLDNEKPTNNRKETALGCECLTYCLLVPIHLPSRSFSTTWPRSNGKQTGWLS